MDFSIKRMDETDLELWKRNSRKKKTVDIQSKEVNFFEQADLISLDNKEANKQNLQITAELISMAQNNKRNNLEEAYSEYLSQKWNNSEDEQKNETLELLKVFFNISKKSLTNTLEDFGRRISNIFDKDLLSIIGLGILNMGVFCVSLCETVVNNLGENRVMCPEFSFQQS